MTTPEGVAQWMFAELQREEYLYQETAVTDIESKFGSDYVYINDNGNLAINVKVLEEFRKITKDSVVWERGERRWRFREDYDPPEKRQVD